MRYSFLALLAALALTGTAPSARAQGPAPASCTLGSASADLSINNAFGRVFNTGSLFFGSSTEAAFYFVPQAAQKSPIYASGLWVGGKVGGQLRMAGGTYNQTGSPSFTFWPGPLNVATGQPVNPATCDSFDRLYNVTQSDIANARTGNVSEDVQDWPVELGAPYFVDTNNDGVRNQDSEPSIQRGFNDPGYGVNGTKINLGANELPDIIGTQGIWWVMNDVGNIHASQNTPPLGIEVQVLAFSFSRADALGNTTFYKYRIINKSGVDITDAYVSIFSDPDLGDSQDDWVGSDVERGLGFVYNADNADGTGSGASYGTPPPAVGYDFFQGPIVADGPDAGSDLDTLGTSAFSYFENLTGPTGDPNTGEEQYNFQQGLWADGTTMRASGNGYGQATGAVTKFAFPGNPVTNQAWSEPNPGAGFPANAGSDRRFAIHTGPFVLGNGDTQDIVFGIVFGQGTSNLNSVTALRAADQLAQTAYDIDFQLAPPPPPPPLCVEGNEVLAPGSGRCLEAVEQNGRATLVFGYPTTSSNYLGRFEQFDALLRNQGAVDSTYNFEGFNIYRYTNSSFETSTRELVATYDVVNGVTTVIDQQFDNDLGGLRDFVVARGTDSGIQYSFDLPNLTNYTDYFYGVTAYAYNEESTPKINESSATTITVRPARLAGGVETQSTVGTPLTTTAATNRGAGTVAARVVDPTRITGDTYEVRFFNPTDADGAAVTSVTTYSIINTRTNQVVLDGQAYYAQSGQAYPQGNNVAVVDGFTFDVNGPEAGFRDFQTVSNAAGPIVPPLDGAMDPNGAANGSQFPDGGRETDHLQTPPLPTGAVRQQIRDASRWGIHTACNSTVTGQDRLNCDYSSGAFNFVLRTLRPGGANIPALGASDYEIRFTAGPNFGYVNFSTPMALIPVPFELWDIGTIEGPSDDVRMFPIINEWPATATGTTGNGIFDLGADHSTSGGADDPQTDWIYWFRPENVTPGRAGYDAALAAAQSQAPGTYDFTGLSEEVMARMVLVNFNGGTAYSGTYNSPMPETGTTFRILTFKPNQPGDAFTINTAGAQRTEATEEDIQRSLDRIAAVPNPYFGSSTYESGNLSRVVRFTNLPEQPATIRIFTVSGSLVTTLNKTSSDRSLDWNLESSNNLPVASGMYLVHVDIEGVGERTLKLGVVNRRTQITIF
ncbi:MAG TPA: T9SS type A sorting domain-containing protein [Rubricoccaceae bacterium]